MFSGRSQSSTARSEAHEPLLSSHTVFAIDDDSDEEELGQLDTPGRVRQPYAAPLRSTISSREAEFDLDSDELDSSHLADPLPTRRGPGYMDQSMPLIVGLYDSEDSAYPLNGGENGDIDLEELAAKRRAGGGLLDSIANMANSILGAGIIGLPYAVSQAGFVFGILLLVVLCGVTDWTIRLIVVNAKLSGRTSYIDIMGHCFGPTGRAAVSVFQFAFAFGGMCAFQIIIGDSIPAVIRSIFPNISNASFPLHLFSSRAFIIILCTTCVSYPLSLHRDIHKLARASALALVGMVIIVVSVLVEGPQVTPDLKGDPKYRFSILGPGVFQAIGVISFAFVCHHNSLLIYGSLRTPTLDRFAKVTHVSTFLSLVACSLLAISAYLVFTNKTQGNILNNFSPNDTLINVARFCFGMNMFTTLPLELFVCREVIEQYFFSHESFHMQRHYPPVSLITCDLGVMLEITGGASATALAFIFPPACYLQLTYRPSAEDRTKLPAVICVGFGCVVLIISVGLALAKSWTTEGKAKMCL
ncbi:amino acid transporter [Flagelloscypha sp. PMI_526]|nr:amino acid transporter [Flagelloscypha sp. PMI_526]